MILGQQLRPGPKPAGDLVEDGAGQSLRHFLGQHGGDQPCCRAISPRSGSISPWMQPQERGFAGAVAAQQAQPFAGLDGEIGPVQDRRAAKAQTNVAQCQKCHSTDDTGQRAMRDKGRPRGRGAEVVLQGA